MVYIVMAAVGLLFIFEGMLPFISPNFWRRMVTSLAVHNDKTIRISGLVCMLIGLCILMLAHYYLAG